MELKRKVIFHVGHSAYTGANAHRAHPTYAAALADLLVRRVPMSAAHLALGRALQGSHATASTKSRLDVVEVVARLVSG